MTKEEIEKAANNELLNENEPQATSIGNFKNGFYMGADWRINAAWHDVSEKPSNGRKFLYVAKFRHTDEEKYDTEYMCEEDSWDGFVTEERIKKWAYVDDLLPERKEEKK